MKKYFLPLGVLGIFMTWFQLFHINIANKDECEISGVFKTIMIYF